MRAMSGRSASCRATSLPIPALAPVISTVFPGSALIVFPLIFCGSSQARLLLPGLRAPALQGFLAEYVPWHGRQLGNPVKPPATEEAGARRATDRKAGG